MSYNITSKQPQGHTMCSRARKRTALSQGREREGEECDKSTDSPGKAPGVAGASIGKCTQPGELAVSKPSLAGKQPEFAHFRVGLHPHSFPPHCPGKFPINPGTAAPVPRAPSPAGINPCWWEQPLRRWRSGRVIKSPTQPCRFGDLTLSKQTIRHDTPVTTGEEGKVVQKFRQVH